LPRFFCVHPVSGLAVGYRPLAERLGGEHPFFGLQARGLDSDEPPFTRIDEMARHYLEEIRQVQPEGPYYLGGWSFGGRVAFEMAAQLADRGQPVALLALLDSFSPSEDAPEIADDARLLALFAREVGLSVYLKDLRPLAADDRLVYLAGLAVRAGLLPDLATGVLYLRRRHAVYRANLAAQRAYEPRLYTGRITFLRARQALDKGRAARQTGDPTCGWQPLSTEAVDVRVVPGNHHSMVSDPHVRHLAAVLHDLIAGTAEGTR
jgi:thioesterase domain-containing protein